MGYYQFQLYNILSGYYDQYYLEEEQNWNIAMWQRESVERNYQQHQKQLIILGKKP